MRQKCILRTLIVISLSPPGIFIGLAFPNVSNSSPGVCTNATAPSVSSINRILRNRAAERAAAEFARAAGYGLYAAPPPYGAFPWAGGGGVWSPGGLSLPPGVSGPPPGMPHPDAMQQGFLSSARGLIGKHLT